MSGRQCVTVPNDGFIPFSHTREYYRKPSAVWRHYCCRFHWKPILDRENRSLLLGIWCYNRTNRSFPSTFRASTKPENLLSLAYTSFAITQSDAYSIFDYPIGRHVIAKGGGGAQPNNVQRNAHLLNYQLFVYLPLAEQQRIVAKIEELFSVLDNIQNALEA